MLDLRAACAKDHLAGGSVGYGAFSQRCLGSIDTPRDMLFKVCCGKVLRLHGLNIDRTTIGNLQVEIIGLNVFFSLPLRLGSLAVQMNRGAVAITACCAEYVHA